MVKQRRGAAHAARAALLIVVLLVLSGSVAQAAAPAHIARLGGAPTRQALSLVLPLSADVSGLQRLATAVSTPGSPRYHHYLSVAQLARRFGATVAVRARVMRYLRSAGARDVRIDRTGLFADATMSVARAQRTFGAALARYQAGRATRFIAPSTPVRVPAGLSGAVTGVVGLDTRPLFGSPSAAAAGGAITHGLGSFRAANVNSGYGARSGTPSGCAGAIADRGFTPNQYLTAYDFAGLQAAGATGTGERVALIEIDGFKYQDITSFAGCFGLRVPAINGFGVGLKRPLAPGGESTLDLEVLDAAAPGLRAIDVYESRSRASDVLRALTAPLQNRGRTPDVISASLGTCEPELALAVGTSGIRAIEGALALESAAGISVLAASGDSGSSDCIGRDGPIAALAVNFPASSPYVTAVGGTNLELDATNQISAQITWNDAPDSAGAGGGGLSHAFSRPSYQKGFLSSRFRGVPDVALLSDPLPGYAVYCTATECAQGGGPGPWIAVGGTSAATPLLAGGFALVDQVLREHGKQNLGSANAVMYRIAHENASAGVFSDVTTSDNDLGAALSSHKALGCCAAGPGYDLATGLGGVDLGKLAFLTAGDQAAIASVGVSVGRQRPLAHRCRGGAAELQPALPGLGSADHRRTRRATGAGVLFKAPAAQEGLPQGDRASERPAGAGGPFRAAPPPSHLRRDRRRAHGLRQQRRGDQPPSPAARHRLSPPARFVRRGTRLRPPPCQGGFRVR